VWIISLCISSFLYNSFVVYKDDESFLGNPLHREYSVERKLVGGKYIAEERLTACSIKVRNTVARWHDFQLHSSKSKPTLRKYQ
jgi:hypothetical protein